MMVARAKSVPLQLNLCVFSNLPTPTRHRAFGYSNGTNLAQTFCAAFTIGLASNGCGVDERGHDQVESEVVHRRRSVAAHRDLPRAPAQPCAQQASGIFGARRRGRRGEGGGVAFHKLRSDDSDRSLSALPSLIRFSRSTTKRASRLLGTPFCFSVLLRRRTCPESALPDSRCRHALADAMPNS